MRMILCLLLILTGCSDSRNVMDALPNSSIAGAARENMSESRMEAPLARPVIIGEDGPRMDACGAMGMVTRGSLPLRAAPFDEARTIATLEEGDRMHVCTRSLDQRWLGVILPPRPDGQDDADNSARPQPAGCGVTEPVDRKQSYDGPCVSGWVSSARVRLIAG